jgi:hypothetical protein
VASRAGPSGCPVTPATPGAAWRWSASSAARRGAPWSLWWERDVRRSCRCRLPAGRRRASAAGRPSSWLGVQGRGGGDACPWTGGRPSRPAPPSAVFGNGVGPLPPADGLAPCRLGCRPATPRGGLLGEPADTGAPAARARASGPAWGLRPRQVWTRLATAACPVVPSGREDHVGPWTLRWDGEAPYPAGPAPGPRGAAAVPDDGAGRGAEVSGSTVRVGNFHPQHLAGVDRRIPNAQAHLLLKSDAGYELRL